MNHEARRIRVERATRQLLGVAAAGLALFVGVVAYGVVRLVV